MSSIVSRGTDDTRATISLGDSRKSAGDHPSKRSESSRTAASPRSLTSAMIFATVSRRFAFAASLSTAGRPFFRYFAISTPRGPSLADVLACDEYSPPRRGGVAARPIKKPRSHLFPRRRGGQFGAIFSRRRSDHPVRSVKGGFAVFY